MIGQGSPDSPCRGVILGGPSGRFLVWVLLVLFRVAGTYADEGKPPLGLRIQWGGAGSWQWTGRLWLSEGELREPRTIIASADAPGSIFVDERGVRVVQPRARPFDGFDVLAVGALETTLLNIDFHRQDLPGPYPTIQIPLKQLYRGFREITLDKQQNRLLVQRVPGDKLTIRLDRSHLVFQPGEELHVTVVPNVPSPLGDVPMRLTAELYDVEGSRVVAPFVQELKEDLRGRFAGLKPVVMRLPDEEGVYDLDVKLSEPRSRRRLSISKSTTVAQRIVQLVVIDDRPVLSFDTIAPREVMRIDPTAPNWRSLIAKPIASISRREINQPSDNGHSRIWPHGSHSFVQLEPRGWHAYPVSFLQPGTPHVVEVTYPADIPQTLAVSVVEDSGPGGSVEVPFHSAVHLRDDLVEKGGSLQQHRMLFWPRTASPRIVLTNRQSEQMAAFGTIRILKWTAGLSPETTAHRGVNTRQFLAYYEQPWFTKNFNATKVMKEFPPSEIHDWQTFYEGGTRFAQYLKHVGHDGALLNVYGQGSTLYPSQLLEPNSKYDRGSFLAWGQDPFRKDVLEMLFRQFKRQGLTLVPTLRFEAPLPALERLCRMVPAESGLRLIGPSGQLWPTTKPSQDGAAPHYNPLDPRVQAAILEVVQELVSRYGQHPSFGGLALDISPDGFAVLPGTYWGLDDQTVGRFTRATGVTLPEHGQQRYVKRAEFLRQNGDIRNQWMAWRASQIADFHRRVHAVVAAQQSSAKLFLIRSDLLENPSVRNALAPTLPAKGDAEFAQALLSFGIDARSYRDDQRIVLVQPRVMDLSGIPDSGQKLLRIGSLPEADFYFGGTTASASLLFHQPLELMSDEWTDVLHSGASNASVNDTLLLSPSGVANRRRFAQALARGDAQVLIEGGEMLPLGQEDSVREFLDVFRQLPAAPFTDAITESTAQPAVIRQLTENGRTCIYFVNESAWDIQVEIQLKLPDGVAPPLAMGTTEMSVPIRRNEQTWWTVPLSPFGLAAAWFDTTQLKVLSVRATIPDHVESQLDQTIQHLFDRLAQLERLPKLGLPLNASFEQDPFQPSINSTWECNAPGSHRVSWQPFGAFHGEHCLRATRRNGDARYSVVSAPFVPPSTGRLQTQVYLRVTDAEQQPELRLTLEVSMHGKPVERRSAKVGKNSDQPLSETWEKYVLPVNDLPLENVNDMRIRIDIQGEGEVWVDSVQTSALAPFSINELRELKRIIGSARYHLRERNISKCQRVLNSYWPRFLEEHIPLSNPRIAIRAEIGPVSTSPPSTVDDDSESWFDQLKKRLTPRWPRF